MTYSYNNRQEVDFDSELSELTDLAHLSGCMNIVFYERKDGFWVEIDARKEMAESQKRRELVQRFGAPLQRDCATTERS